MRPMKILIGFDGSEHARAAIADSRRACLPAEAECIVLSASEVWTAADDEQVLALGDTYAASGEVAAATSHGVQALHSAKAIAEEGAALLREWFPNWHIVAEARSDAPTWALINRILEWQADLLIVGTHGRSALSRVILGSVSQKLLAEAACSVRIARAPWTSTPAAVRTIIAIDEFRDSMAAIEEAAQRTWTPGSAIHLISAFNITLSGFEEVARFMNPADLIGGNDDELELIRKQLTNATKVLGATGATVTSEIKIGSPVAAILDVAAGWGADSIMLSARGHRFLERIVLGSVSATLANRAGCSIEVVRPWRHAHDENSSTKA